jgi:hypothetical protein
MAFNLGFALGFGILGREFYFSTSLAEAAGLRCRLLRDGPT